MGKRFLTSVVLIVLSVLLMMSAGCSVEVSAQSNGNGSGGSGLIISEVVSSNSNSLVDPVYGQPDWIELCNTSESAINLKDYAIMETINNQYFFPELVLGPGEYLLVYCCKEPEGVETEAYCTGFKLSKSGTALTLSSPKEIIQVLDVPELETDVSYGISEDGTYKYFIPTPGEANTSRSFDSLEELQSGHTATVKINEILPRSASEAEPYAWVELYNDGTETAELSNLYITENLSNPTKARLPDMQLSPGEYAVIRFTGQTGADEVPFSISRSETTLAILSSLGAVVDSITWDANTVPGVSAGPGESGVIYFAEPTPGQENGAAYLESGSFQESVGEVRINEMLLNNTFSAIDEDGERSAWVELYNASDNTVDLGAYALSDNSNRLLKWRLPSREFKPGEYALVFLSGKDRTEGSELHTNFRLGKDETKLYLTELYSGTYEAADVPENRSSNISYGLSSDGQWLFYPQPTPLMPNDTQGFTEIAAALDASASGLVINEVATVSTAKSGKPDWVEIYNNQTSDVDLTGYSLSDSRNDLFKWPVSAKTVKAGDYTVIDEYTKDDEKGRLDIRFSGEMIYLTSPAGVVLDQFETGLLRPGLSRGIVGDAAERVIGLFTTPTPGAQNSSDTVSGYCAAPFFSEQGGYKSAPVMLEISTPTPSATIHYTLDGSTPTPSSAVYTEPIAVSSSKTVRALAVAPGKLESDETVATYLLEEKHALPVICLSMTESDLKYVFGSQKRSDERERAGYVEYYEPDGTLGVRFPAGFRIAGAGTRLYAQRSINLYLRGGYGRSSVTYPFFDDYELTTFKSLSLRNMGQDRSLSCVRDAYFHTVTNGLNILNMRTRFAVVYINGAYWGLYEFKENQNDDYLAAKFGIDPDKVEFIRSTKYAYKGNSKMINQLFSIAGKSSGSRDMWEEYMSLIDVDYFTDYLVVQTYISNSDYYNQKYTHTTDNSLTWRPMFYDLDWGLKNGARSGAWAFFGSGGVTNTDELGEVTSFVDMGLYYALYRNDEWRSQFVKRYAEVMNTTFSTENMLAVYDGMVASIRDEMPRHIARWGSPSSLGRWENEIDDLRDTIVNRRSYIISELKKRFGLSDTEAAQLWPNG
jgi:hypothetical protein